MREQINKAIRVYCEAKHTTEHGKMKLNIESAKKNAAQMDNSKLEYKLNLAKEESGDYWRDWINVLEAELNRRMTGKKSNKSVDTVPLLH